MPEVSSKITMENLVVQRITLVFFSYTFQIISSGLFLIKLQ